MCISPQRHAILRHLNRQKWSKHAVFCTFWLSNVHFATAAYNFWTSELQKVVPDPQFFNIFTSECAFRHSGVQFLNIWTSKSGPGPSVFLTFLLPNVLFPPQRRTIFQHLNFQKWSRIVSFLTFSLPNVLFRHSGVQFFRHLNFQKWSKHAVFCTFWLANVLFATAACNFWFLLWAPTSAPAALTGLLFDWPDTRIIEKNTAFRDFSNIWRGCIFFLLTFALLYLLSTDLATLLRSYASAFQLSILSEVSI